MGEKEMLEFLNNEKINNGVNQNPVTAENFVEIMNNFKFKGVHTGSSDSYFDD